MSELWDLLLSAQESSAGIPEVFMAQKKEEIKQRKVSRSVVPKDVFLNQSWPTVISFHLKRLG